MKRPIVWISFLLCFLPSVLRSQDAPVTKVGSVTNAAAGNVTIPITATNFVNIATMSLTLDFTQSVIQYISALPNPALSSTISINSSTPGRLVISWYGDPLTFPDQTHLVDLTFHYTAGTSFLTWFDNGGSCQYTNGSYSILNDTPTASFYINGVVTNHTAPVTYAPYIYTAVSGNTVSAPITVSNFTNIGSISLTLEYRSSVLTYQNITLSPALSGGTLNVSTSGPTGGKMRLIISWFGEAGDIPDGGTLFTVNFGYTSANGITFSELNWIDLGGTCQYTDQVYSILYDSPTADYYKNGLITSESSPVTYLPTITTATPGGSVTVPVRVNGCTNVRTISLLFEYDPTKLTFTGFTQNPAFGGTIDVGDNYISATKRKIVIGWFGNAVSLPDGDYIVNINFTYISGIALLSFNDTDPTSCEYGDMQFHAFYDKPQSTYYIDGVVTSRTAPITKADSTGSSPGQVVIVPVKVWQFTDIGSLSLTLDYDPGVLSYLFTVPNASIASDFLATSVNAGRLTFSWFGSGVTLPDTTHLFEIHFIYHGGNSPLIWNLTPGTCQYTDGTAYQILYDQPKSAYYINGMVGQAAIADFTADNWLPLVGETVTFTDLSLGTPTSWLWTFSPATVTYVNGTTATSRNPKVQFTVNGIYSVTLRASNSYSHSVKTKIDTIHAGDHGLWTGITSTSWNVASNWHNYLVPRSTWNVTITDSPLPTYWPVFTGNLSLGDPCKDITLIGNAQLTVTGNLVITPGNALNFTGSGILELGGNWSNSGVFIHGTGTVIFTGTNVVEIFGVTTFFNLTASKISPGKLINNTTVTVDGNMVISP